MTQAWQIRTALPLLSTVTGSGANVGSKLASEHQPRLRAEAIRGQVLSLHAQWLICPQEALAPGKARLRGQERVWVTPAQHLDQTLPEAHPGPFTLCSLFFNLLQCWASCMLGKHSPLSP